MFKKIWKILNKKTVRVTAVCLAAVLLLVGVSVPGTMVFGESTGTSGEKEAEPGEAAFVSGRLVLLADGLPDIPDGGEVIGQHENVYLLQFPSAKKAMDAYDCFKDTVDAVEPDITVEIAENEENAGNGESVEAEMQIDEKENPVLSLHDAAPVPGVQKKDGVIALIDTGVSDEMDQVIGRVSLIDDVLAGGTHGEDMLAAILSQDEKAQVLSIRALDDKGFGTVSSLVAAMEYAMEQGVDIINLSLYARSTLSTSVLRQEIEKAAENGILVVGAAGNDGQDASGYVPGSVEAACIIGAADESGVRLKTSNYGKTVDYNVAAGSTSEAAALFTGFLSANSMDAVKDALNGGLIYETDFAAKAEEKPIGKEEDFTAYELDRSKSVIVKYFFVDAEKYREGDTIDDIFDRIYDEEDTGCYVGSADDTYTDVYRTKDGVYKFRAQIPFMAGYMAADEYKDAVFTYGTYGGEVVTEGVDFNRKNGVATIQKSVFRDKKGDFADIQLQLMVPVSNTGVSVETKTNIEVIDTDGSSSKRTISGSGLGESAIPLSVTGLDEKLTDDDFTVYINDRREPVKAFHWDEEEHSLKSRISACLLYKVRVEVKRKTDAVFHVAAGKGEAGGTNAAFYLDLTDKEIETIQDNEDKGYYRDVPVEVYGVPASLKCTNTNIVQVTGGVGNYDDTWDDSSNSKWLGVIGTPKSKEEEKLFGLGKGRFNWRYKSGKEMGNFKFKYPDGQAGEYSSINVGLKCVCIHSAQGLDRLKNDWTRLRVRYMLTNDWTEKKDGKTYTYFCMTAMGKKRVNGSSLGQTMGGSLVFAVENVEPEPERTFVKVSKLWQDVQDMNGSRPASTTVVLQKAEAPKGTQDYGEYTDALRAGATQVLSEANKWSYTWNDLPTEMSDGRKLIWTIREVEPAGYRLITKNKSGSRLLGYKYRPTNRKNPEYTGRSIEKKWEDGGWEKRPENAYVQLQYCMREIVEGDTKGAETKKPWPYEPASGLSAEEIADSWRAYNLDGKNSNIILNEGNGWKYSWTGLRKMVYHGEGATEYDYRIVEYTDTTFKTPGAPENYEYSLTGSTMTNTLTGGWVKIHKSSGNPDMTDNNRCYNLKGAQFTFYKDEACTQVIGTVTTDEKGNTEKLYTGMGTVWYRETKSTDDGHFLVDKEPHRVLVEKDSTTEQPLEVNVVEEPGNDAMGIEIEKLSDGGDAEKAPGLAGVQFTVNYYDNMDKDISGKPTRTWVLAVKKRINGTFGTSFDEECKVGGDEFYLDPHTKKPVLPYGTYSIQETKAAPDYLLEGTLTDQEGGVTISFDEKNPGSYVTVVTDDKNGGISLVGGNKYRAANKPVPMSLTVKKYGDKKEPLKDVTFRIQSESGLTEKQDGWKETMTTGDDGTVKWTDLVPGTYTITEIKTGKGRNLLQKPIKVELPMRMTKKEAEKNGLADPGKDDKLDGVVWDENEEVFYINDPTYTATNGPAFRLPMTGSRSGFAAFFPLAVGFVLLRITGKRRESRKCGQ